MNEEKSKSQKVSEKIMELIKKEEMTYKEAAAALSLAQTEIRAAAIIKY